MGKPQHPSERPVRSAAYPSRLLVSLRWLGRHVVRWTKRLLITLGIFVAFVLALLAALQLTESGRALVLRVALEQTNALIPGTIEARRLGRLSLLGVELWGVRATDPQGREIARIEHIAIETDLSRLLKGSIALSSARLEHAWVDLRQLDQKHDGLLAAFVDADAPPSPPSSSPPPHIVVRNIALSDVQAELPELEQLGALHLELRSLRGNFALLDGSPDVDVASLELRTTRDEEELLSLELAGHLQAQRAASTLHLRAHSGPVELVVDAQGVTPMHAAWESEPLRAAVSLRGLTAAHLAEVLRDESLAQAFLGELNLRLQADGKAEDVTVDGAVETAGGTLHFDEMRAHDDQVHVALSTEGIELNQVRADLPARKVAAVVIADTQGFPPDPVQLSLRLEKGKLDDVQLPRLQASADYSSTGLQNLDVQLRDGESQIKLSGDASFNGAVQLGAQVDLRPELIERLAPLVGEQLSARLTGNVSIARAETGRLVASGALSADQLRRPGKSNDEPELTLEHFAARFSVDGPPDQLKGRLEGSLQQLQYGDKQLDSARIEAAGNLQSLDVNLSAEGGIGEVDPAAKRSAQRSAALTLKAHVERKGSTTTVTGKGSGTVQGQEVSFEMQPTTVTDQGAISSAGVDLQLAGQKFHLQGALSPDAALDGLVIEFGPITLQEIPEVLRIAPEAVGVISGRARVSGTTRVPVLQLEAEAHDLGLKRRPKVAAKLVAQLDAAAGSSELQLTAQSPSGLSAQLDAKAAFAPGEQWLATLARAEFDATLDLQRLHSDFLSRYLPPGLLPVELEAKSHARVFGSIADPRLESHSEVQVTLIGEKPAVVSLDAAYAQGKLPASLRVRDGHGAWIELLAELQLSGAPTASELGPAFAHAASEAAWTVDLDVKKRPLAQLAVLSLVLDPAELPPLETGLQLHAEHAAQSEPTIHLQWEARQSGKWDVAACKADGLELTASFRHEGTNNELVLLGAHGASSQQPSLSPKPQGSAQSSGELLRFTAHLPLALQPILAGKSPILGPLDLELATKKLQLASLPFVCGRANGEVQAELSGKDLLGASPQLHALVQAQQFSLGSRDTLDIQFNVEADSSRLLLDLLARNPNSQPPVQGKLGAEVPWHFANGKIEVEENLPLQAQLHLNELPIAPLLPPRGAISYARGRLNGDVQVAGRLQSPELHGELLLSDIAFTSTAIAQPLRGVEGRIVLDGRKVNVTHLEAHDQDGVLVMDGVIDLSDMKKLHGKLHLTAKEFPIRQRGQVVAETNLQATAESTVTPEHTDARLTLRDVDTWLESVSVRSGIELEAHDDFIINGKAAPGSTLAAELEKESAEARLLQSGDSSSQEEKKATNTVTLIIDAKDRFWVKRDDFAVKLSTLLRTEITDDGVRVKGDVTIDRGYLQLFGKVFDLKRESKIRFIGSNPPNPVLELEAEHKSRSGSIVLVRISGRGDAPVLNFFIDGGEVDAGVAVQELFGAQKGGSDSDASTQAQSFVSGLTAGVLATAARRELGAAAPIIMIDPSDKAGEGRVRAGFELDDIVPAFLRPIVTGAYLEGIVARESDGASDPNTQFGALLELYFPRNFFTAGQYGPGTTWSVDFGWQL